MARLRTSLLTFPGANMTYTLHSQDDRFVDVTIDDGEGLSIRKKMDLQPYGVDEIVTVPHPEKEGEFIQQMQVRMVDPFDDLSGFFANYMEAYKRGKRVEEDAKAPKQALEKALYFVPQESNSQEAAAE
mgnify:CR=1 FL=1